MLITQKNVFTATSRLVYDQITWHHILAKLTYEINHHIALLSFFVPKCKGLPLKGIDSICFEFVEVYGGCYLEGSRSKMEHHSDCCSNTDEVIVTGTQGINAIATVKTIIYLGIITNRSLQGRGQQRQEV